MTAHFRSVVRTLLVFALLVLGTSADAAVIQLRAWLNGAQEVPPVGTGATGLAVVTYNTVTRELAWNVSYTPLSSAIVGAHFHGPTGAGVDAGITVFMAHGPSPIVGSATIDAAQAAQLLAGQWYVNLHSNDFQGGEIRGQVLPVTGDFNADGRADVLWRNSASGENYIYPLNGTTILAGEGFLRTVPDQAWRVKRMADFNGDGKADILWRNNTTGENYIYFMDGTSIIAEGFLRTVADQNWQVEGVGDFNGDGKADIFWRNGATGENYMYLMDGTSIIGEGYLRTVADLGWYVGGVGDVNGDGKADLVWRFDGNAQPGQNYIYMMDGLSIAGEGFIRTVADTTWDIVGVADFDGDGRADIFWRNFATGENYIYPMAGLTILPSEGYVRTVADLAWQIVALGDYDGDGRADVLWRNATTGENYLYPMAGTSILAGEGYLRSVVDQNWKVVGYYTFENEPQQPTLWIQHNIFGTFDGITGTLTSYPADYVPAAVFRSGQDFTTPDAVFFTGPQPESGLIDSMSISKFSFSNGAVYFSRTPQINLALPGGPWTVNYENQDIAFNLPDPDTNNRLVVIEPTVTLVGDNVTQVAWIYKNRAGNIASPAAYGSSIEIRINAIVGAEVRTVYSNRDLEVATTSHPLPFPVAWTSVTSVSLILHDDLGNEYASHWVHPPPVPTISAINPTEGTIGTQVTITGTNFGCQGCDNPITEVRFEGPEGGGPFGVAASFTIDMPTQLTATVPPGALSGTIFVQSNMGGAFSEQIFTVLP